jgi:hypothetical protein
VRAEISSAAREAGADGFLLKRSISSDILPTIAPLLEIRNDRSA